MRTLFLVLLAACGNSTPHQQVIVIDAPIDTTADAPPAQPTQITLQAFPTPSFIAYRDGQGAWQTPAAGTMNRYTLTVTADYQVVAVCANGTSSYADLLDATASDGSQFVFCNGGTDDTPPPTVAVTGHMLQAGQIYLGDGASSTTPAWDFSLNVPTGMHELVATSTGNGIVIRRGLNITAAGSVPTIDVTTEGAPMTAVPLTINNLGSDMLLNEYDLFMQHDFAFWTTSSSTIYVPPAALIVSGDFQGLTVQAFGQTTSRFAEVQYDGSQSTFDLPDPLTGIVFGPGKASFGTLPAFFAIDLDLSAPNVEQRVQATQGFLDATHATSLAFDAAPPGYDSAWTVDTSGSYLASFEVANDVNGVDEGSIVFNHAPAQRAVNRPWFSTVARVRESMRSQHTIPRR